MDSGIITAILKRNIQNINNMKKILSFILCVIVFASCTEHDEVIPEETLEVALSSYYYEYDKLDVITFKKSGEVVWKDYYYKSSVPGSLTSNKSISCTIYFGKWKLADSTLKITWSTKGSKFPSEMKDVKYDGKEIITGKVNSYTTITLKKMSKKSDPEPSDFSNPKVDSGMFSY